MVLLLWLVIYYINLLCELIDEFVVCNGVCYICLVFCKIVEECFVVIVF